MLVNGKFKLNRARQSIIKPLFRKPEVLKDEKDEPPFFILGQQADSKEEWWVYLALTRLAEYSGLTFDYQVPIYGGRSRAGGLVIDFIVHLGARTFWLDPMGKYWHTGQKEDRDQLANAARRRHVQLIAWFTEETPTKESIFIFLRKELGL
jgi:hypothetical protein